MSRDKAQKPSGLLVLTFRKLRLREVLGCLLKDTVREGQGWITTVSGSSLPLTESLERYSCKSSL